MLATTIASGLPMGSISSGLPVLAGRGRFGYVDPDLIAGIRGEQAGQQQWDDYERKRRYQKEREDYWIRMRMEQEARRQAAIDASQMSGQQFRQNLHMAGAQNLFQGRLNQQQNDFQLQRDQQQSQLGREDLFQKLRMQNQAQGRVHTPEQEQSLKEIDGQIEAVMRKVHSYDLSWKDAQPLLKRLDEQRQGIEIFPRGYAQSAEDTISSRIVNHPQLGPVMVGPDGSVQQFKSPYDGMGMGGGGGVGGANGMRMQQDVGKAILNQFNTVLKDLETDPGQLTPQQRQDIWDQVTKDVHQAYGVAPRAQQQPGTTQQQLAPTGPSSVAGQQSAVDPRDADHYEAQADNILLDPDVQAAFRVNIQAAQPHALALAAAMKKDAAAIRTTGQHDPAAASEIQNSISALSQISAQGAQAGRQLIQDKSHQYGTATPPSHIDFLDAAQGSPLESARQQDQLLAEVENEIGLTLETDQDRVALNAVRQLRQALASGDPKLMNNPQLVNLVNGIVDQVMAKRNARRTAIPPVDPQFDQQAEANRQQLLNSQADVMQRMGQMPIQDSGQPQRYRRNR